jgi:hypothetical protein
LRSSAQARAVALTVAPASLSRRTTA